MDASTRDDAAVFRISEDRALVATVDFFTPIVDDPADWGRISAANALSDIYAMGGTPLFALSLVGWPRATLPFEMLGEVMRGATEITTRAGCLLLGGHSVDDPEPKFGLCAIGEARPDELWTNKGARPGDNLVLTKPLGTGILATALKRGLLDEAGFAPAVNSMVTLNEGAARAGRENGVRSATDITGFGLVGHLGNILRGSGVGAELWFDQIPFLEGAEEFARQGVVPGGTERNLEAAADTRWDDLNQTERLLCCDAQTSGGLLLAIPEARTGALVTGLQSAEAPAAAVIGRITSGKGLRIHRERGT